MTTKAKTSGDFNYFIFKCEKRFFFFQLTRNPPCSYSLKSQMSHFFYYSCIIDLILGYSMGFAIALPILLRWFFRYVSVGVRYEPQHLHIVVCFCWGSQAHPNLISWFWTWKETESPTDHREGNGEVAPILRLRAWLVDRTPRYPYSSLKFERYTEAESLYE